MSNYQTSPTGSRAAAETSPEAGESCFHCGTACGGKPLREAGRAFCCQGCLTVFGLLTENGLADFYRLDQRAGVRIAGQGAAGRFDYLDEPEVRERIVNFSNDRVTRVTFRLPAIHCVACVWLLENLFKLQPAVGRTEVNFLRKEASVTFDPNGLKLSRLVELLASLGYEPELKLSDLETNGDTKAAFRAPRRLWLQLGVAGFGFGNNMLFGIAQYLGLDAVHDPAARTLIGYMSMALAVPVLLYSAQDYFKRAWIGLKHRMLTIEVPIAAGIVIIFAQSAVEVLGKRGDGYFDSFCGLLFFLLCGRLFQEKTFGRLVFDRDFKSFFPLAITRLTSAGQECVSLSQLKTGDRLVIRNGELIPADSKLLKGQAFIDYSFVTGEADLVEKLEGDSIYAGGRQIGGSIEIRTAKAVSQSYLTSLWNQDAFAKPVGESLDTLINRYSQRFTKIIVAIALGAGAYWSVVDPSLALKAMTSVLIVACPCALALAAPFTMGTALRVLGRKNIFLKNAEVIERLAKVDTVVFDKTGTLTATGVAAVEFRGEPLNAREKLWIHSLTRHSTHPYAVRICEAFQSAEAPREVRSFLEIPGCGIEAGVDGREIALGSAQWLGSRGTAIPEGISGAGGVVHVAVDGRHRGAFVLANELRRDVKRLIGELDSYNLALLSGDNDKQRASFEELFGAEAELKFNQSPTGKLEFVRELQASGRKVLMVGDGLNDAGALRQSDVGVAAVESIGAFSPASDIILTGGMVSHLASLLRFGKGSVRLVRASFAISTVYNAVGIAIAAKGMLTPVVCAILMPLSSVSVMAFACLATGWLGRSVGPKPQNNAKNQQ